MNNAYQNLSILTSKIQTQLLLHPAIYQCIVLQRINSFGQIVLIAYIVSDQDIVLDNIQKMYAQYEGIAQLAYILRVNALPYQKNGEIDVAALEKFPIISNTSDIYFDYLQECEIALFKSSHKDALVHGEKIQFNLPADSLPGLLCHTANIHSDKGIRILGKNGVEEFFSYENLLVQARKVAAGLEKNNISPQTPILFQLRNIKEIFILFWGAILRGCIPVPLAVPLQYNVEDQTARKLIHTLDSLPSSTLIMDNSTLLSYEYIRQQSPHSPVICEIETLLQSEPGEIKDYSIDKNSVVLYLQTSGSTSAPKIVPQTHSRLLQRSAASIHFNQLNNHDVSLNCFPLDHVCGLVMFHLRDVMLGCNQIHAPINEFLSNPLNWLGWCHKYKVTLTWAPNFAFNLINSYQHEFNKYQWDLSSIRFIENCAEPVVAAQNLRYLQLLARFGLKPNVIRPAWGMSETCSVMTISNSFDETQVNSDVRYVKVGKPFPNSSIRVVDENDQITKQEVNGKLQVKGEFIFKGYLNNEVENSKSFTSDGWFDTGDTAQIIDDELVIVGRTKDVIIINGINIAAHEIERCVEQIPGIMPSFTAAIAVTNETDSADQLTVFFVSDKTGDDLSIIITLICSKVSREIGIAPNYLFKVERDEIPKTAIGKIQKEKLRLAFKQNIYKPIYIAGDFAKTELITLTSTFNKIWLRQESYSRNTLPKNVLLIFVKDNAADFNLAELNYQYSRIVIVRYGVNYMKLSDSVFTIDFLQMDHLHKLFADVAPVSGIVYLQSSASNDVYFHLQANIKLYQSIVSHNIKPFLMLNFLIKTEHAINHFIGGASASLLRTMNAEQNIFYCRNIEIQPNNTLNLATIISTELNDLSKEPEIKYINNSRHVCRLASLSKQNSLRKMKSGGTYLIIGSLGGIATYLASKILTTYDAKVILCGRSKINKFSVVQLERLNDLQEKYPGCVSYSAIDITNIKELLLTFKNTVIDGVFNLAAVMDKNSLMDINEDILKKTLSPKWEGTWNLYQLSEQLQIPLIVNFSSVNGYFGGAGAGAYSIANSIQEEISEYVNENSKSVTMINIAWSMWNNVGLSYGSVVSELTKMQGYQILEPANALDQLIAVLSTNLKNVLIGLDKMHPRMKVHLHLPATPAKIPVTVDTKMQAADMYDDFGSRVICRRELNHPDHQPNSIVTKPAPKPTHIGDMPALMSDLITIWQSVGISNAAADINIFELGTKSIMIPSILLKIEDRFKVNVSVIDLFQYTTLSTLANFIQQKLNEVQVFGI